MDTQYQALFQPLKIGQSQQTELKNRLIMGSMHTGLEENKDNFKALSYFYKQRAKGGVAMIVTGGIAPCWRGWLKPFSAKLTRKSQIQKYQTLAEAVHPYNCKILIQLLHAGRYGYHPFIQAPSAIKSPITPFKPHKMSTRSILKCIHQFAKSAQLTQQANIDGVEIIGSEGYLIHQFLAKRTNHRTDKWGGSIENRARFALEIVNAIREKVGSNFILMFRISIIDLVENGLEWPEIIYLAKALEAAGVDILNSGIGWHESRVPTIASIVPRGLFAERTGQLRSHISIPIVTSNRINHPELANHIIERKQADLISMARPLLADPELPNKAKNHKTNEINTCIACNQACLDHVFLNTPASCLVNPFAGRELTWKLEKTNHPQKIAVIGAGVAGLSAALYLAQKGHTISLIEQSTHIGGQFQLAAKIPGKTDYQETIRYFETQLQKFPNIHVRLNCRLTSDQLMLEQHAHIIIATGVTPRIPHIPNIEHPSVIKYSDFIQTPPQLKGDIAIIGSGGIGIDVATLIAHQQDNGFTQEWGIDLHSNTNGLTAPNVQPLKHTIYLCQRSQKKLGKTLGKTTAWIHRAYLKKKNIQLRSDLTYLKIDDEGLHIQTTTDAESQCLPVKHIIICAGQKEENTLYHELHSKSHLNLHIIGGANKAGELDAKRAIEEAAQIAINI